MFSTERFSVNLSRMMFMKNDKFYKFHKKIYSLLFMCTHFQKTGDAKLTGIAYFLGKNY